VYTSGGTVEGEEGEQDILAELIGVSRVLEGDGIVAIA